MKNLFNLLPDVNLGIIRNPFWIYVRQGLRNELGTIIQYYRKNPTAVKSSHFLVRLLHSITIPKTLTLDRYYANVDGIAMNLSMAMGMTSSIYKGKIFKGIFYGPDCHEILIATNDRVDFETANKDWKNQTPVTVLRHPVSDLGLNILDGRKSSVESGISVILINIPLLAVMYRAFRNNEAVTVSAGESEKSTMQFIRMYVLPNMLLSHVDYAVFNRINNLLTGAPMGESIVKHPFYLTDFSARVNALDTEILKLLENQDRNFTGILRSVPAIAKYSMDDVMYVPDMVQTRQVLWALLIARLPALSFLFRTTALEPGTRNRSEINRVFRMFLSLKMDRVMETTLPRELFYEINDEIQSIIRTVKEREHGGKETSSTEYHPI